MSPLQNQAAGCQFHESLTRDCSVWYLLLFMHIFGRIFRESCGSLQTKKVQIESVSYELELLFESMQSFVYLKNGRMLLQWSITVTHANSTHRKANEKQTQLKQTLANLWLCWRRFWNMYRDRNHDFAHWCDTNPEKDTKQIINERAPEIVPFLDIFFLLNISRMELAINSMLFIASSANNFTVRSFRFICEPNEKVVSCRLFLFLCTVTWSISLDFIVSLKKNHFVWAQKCCSNLVCKMKSHSAEENAQYSAFATQKAVKVLVTVVHWWKKRVNTEHRSHSMWINLFGSTKPERRWTWGGTNWIRVDAVLRV